MILPRLCINDNKHKIELYYPEKPNDTIAIIDVSKECSYHLLINLLIMAQDNYEDGYDIGYNDALEDNIS